MSAVKDDIPANGRWGGFFAQPTKQWVPGDRPRWSAWCCDGATASQGGGARVMEEEAPVRFRGRWISMKSSRRCRIAFPMLLIDRVLNIRTDYSGIGIKNVTFNELPFFSGTFRSARSTPE